MKRINIFVGHYGSGKTELAVNFAIKNKVDLIADLDTVNPYFRTNDAKEILEKSGIRVVAPYYAGTNVDLPSLPPEVYAAFTDNKTAVLDIGGDDDGAYVLGRFKEYITEENSEVYFVINVLRPETDSAEKIIEILDYQYEQAMLVDEMINSLFKTFKINNITFIKITFRRTEQTIVRTFLYYFKTKVFNLHNFLRKYYSIFCKIFQ